ncbi:hypothetical protein PG984_013664 [Apiospora sp. TS-2023a]
MALTTPVDYSIPLLDINIDKTEQLFDLNVFFFLWVTQAYVPVLLKSRSGMLVNNNSIVSMLFDTLLV